MVHRGLNEFRVLANLDQIESEIMPQGIRRVFGQLDKLAFMLSGFRRTSQLDVYELAAVYHSEETGGSAP